MGTRASKTGMKARGPSVPTSGSEQEARASTTKTGAPVAPAPGTAAALAPQNVPALSAEAVAQAERDKSGKTRDGYVRRDLPTGSYYNGVWYGPGEQREIPQGLADHLGASAQNPDASTEIGRKTRFSGGSEDDQEAQGKAITKLGDGTADAQKKHRESAAFEATPRGGKAKAGAK